MSASHPPSVLFICTANICRSPMAAALFRERLKKERPDCQEWQVASAGTWATEGQMAATYSQRVMAQRGLDISQHRSRMVTAEMLQDYDVILTMEESQKEALQIEFPAIVGRIFLLSEMGGTQEPVEDPFGGSLQDYQEAAERIDAMLEKGLPRIIELAIG